jgi:hypothetical protein
MQQVHRVTSKIRTCSGGGYPVLRRYEAISPGSNRAAEGKKVKYESLNYDLTDNLKFEHRDLKVGERPRRESEARKQHHSPNKSHIHKRARQVRSCARTPASNAFTEWSSAKNPHGQREHFKCWQWK